MKKLFDLKDEHIKLLRNMCVRWDDCEFGAPAIDCKRPYGNSDVYNDIAKILGIQGTVVDDVEMFSQEQTNFMNEMHKEMEIVLQIVLFTGEFRPGEYVADQSADNWRLR